jgi:hypothetical protein
MLFEPEHSPDLLSPVTGIETPGLLYLKSDFFSPIVSKRHPFCFSTPPVLHNLSWQQYNGVVLEKIESTAVCHGHHRYSFISSYTFFSDTPVSGKSS